MHEGWFGEPTPKKKIGWKTPRIGPQLREQHPTDIFWESLAKKLELFFQAPRTMYIIKYKNSEMGFPAKNQL
jgi:hypothetical protein